MKFLHLLSGADTQRGSGLL